MMLDSLHPSFLDFFPHLQGKLPWLRLGTWPTPVSLLPGLSRLTGQEVFVKRDDLSGARYGGNKVRKLEPLLAGVLASGGREVLTAGGLGSNHVVACGLYARDLGLKRTAVVFPQPVTRHVLHTLSLMQALGVELVPCPARPLLPAVMARALLLRGRETCLLMPGGSTPLGTLGFVAGALELRAQIEAGLLPCPDDIIVPLGSGGTMAGLMVGCSIAGLRCRILGVRVVERWLTNLTMVRMLCMRTVNVLHRLGARWRGVPIAVHLEHGQLGDRYGQATPEARQAVALARDLDGLELETTYTGKAMAGLLAHARGQGKGRRLLFWNTWNSRDTRPLLGTSVPRRVPASIRRWLSLCS